MFVRALAKDPAARYPSAAEFVAGLRDAVHAGSPQTEVLATTPARARASRQRLPIVVAMVALLGLGVLVAALIASTRDDGGEAAPQSTTVVRTVTSQGTTQRVTVTAAGGDTDRSRHRLRRPVSPLRRRARFRISRRRRSTTVSGSARFSSRSRLSPRCESRDRTYEAYANYNIGRSLAELDRCDEALPYLERREQLLGPHPDVTAAKQQCGA